MISRTEQIQIQYEIAMAIGSTLELKKMLRKSLSTILRKLNCPAGGVFLVEEEAGGLFELKHTFSIPRKTDRIATYLEAVKRLPPKCTTQEFTKFSKALPIIEKTSEDYYYLLELPGIGIILLLKKEIEIPGDTLNFLKPLLNKLSFACIACLQNEELVRHRNHLQDLVENQTKELLEKNQLLSVAMNDVNAANRLKTEFIANMSHEFRTPLNAIFGYSGFLQKRLAEDKESSNYIQGILDSGAALLNIINDILDISKIESGEIQNKPESLHFKSFLNKIKQIFSLKAQLKGLDLILYIPEHVPEFIHIDESRFRQVLFNLIGNAIKFTEKGFIKIDLDFVKQKNSSNNNNLSIKIKDTGIGIEPEKLDMIFEPFSHEKKGNLAKHGSTGLGLPISKRLVNAMGGSISVNSSIANGSEFILSFNNIEIGEEKEINIKQEENNDIFDVRINEIDNAEAHIHEKFNDIIKDGNYLSSKIFDQLQECALQFYDIKSSSFSMSDLRKVAYNLKELADKHNLVSIKNFASDLDSAAKDFNIQNILDLYDLFEKLILLIKMKRN